MTEQNKAIVRRFVEEVQTRGRLEVGEELLATDFRNRTPDTGSPTDERSGALRQFAMMRSAFPDLRVEIHDMLADRVMTHKTLRGIHRGEFMSMPATERPVAIEGIDILRVRDGQIVEHWVVFDRLSLVRQLGAKSVVRFLLRQAFTAASRRLRL